MLRIHYEGKQFLRIFAALIVSLFCLLLVYTVLIAFIWLAISLIFFGFCLHFFRNPKVDIIQDAKCVLAPADGKVVVIEKVEEPEYLRKPCLQISIFMSPLDVHTNRNPIAGTVEYFKYHRGRYLVAWHPKSSTDNERTTLVVKDLHSQHRILIRQIAGAVARRIRWYVRLNQEVKQGECFGFIKFGSRVDVLLPLNSNILVKLNQKTQGGRTVLAELPSN